MGAKYTDAQKKASKKYLEDFKCIKVRMSADDREKYHKLAQTKGVSLNQLVLDLLEKEYNNI